MPPLEVKDSQSLGQQKSPQEAENGNNDGGLNGRAVTYMIIWIVYTLGTTFLPIGLALLFDLIIGYSPSFSEFAPDYLLMVVSVLFGSAWNTWRNKSYTYKELRQLVMIFQIAFAFFCFIAYFIMYGELSIFIVAKIGRVIPIIIVFVFLGILFADIGWDAMLHRSEYIDELSSKK